MPYICHSAATLIALGCDELIVGPRGQLSPTDPTLHVRTGTGDDAPVQSFGVEDINAFTEFVRNTLGSAFSRHGHESLAKLIDAVPPHLLGSINRNYFRIRLLMEKLLNQSGYGYKKPGVFHIIEQLTVGYYSHNHFICRDEMKNELKLPVIDAEAKKIAEPLWDLYEEYAIELRSRQPLDIKAEFARGKANPLVLEFKGKYVESTARTDVFVQTTTVSGTGTPNYQFTVPQVQGVSPETIQVIVQHFTGELQAQLKPQLVAKVISSFGEWKTE